MILHKSTRAEMPLTASSSLSDKPRMEDWATKYVLHVLDAKGWSMNRLATEAGVAATTINRPLRNPDSYPHRLKPDTIKKIQAASGIDPLPFVPPDEVFPASRPVASGFADGGPRVRLMVDGNRNSLSIHIDGPVVRLIGTLDKQGLSQLRDKIDHLAALLED